MWFDEMKTTSRRQHPGICLCSSWVCDTSSMPHHGSLLQTGGVDGYECFSKQVMKKSEYVHSMFLEPWRWQKSKRIDRYHFDPKQAVDIRYTRPQENNKPKHSDVGAGGTTWQWMLYGSYRCAVCQASSWSGNGVLEKRICRNCRRKRICRNCRRSCLPHD